MRKQPLSLLSSDVLLSPSVCQVCALYPHDWRYRQTSFSAR